MTHVSFGICTESNPVSVIIHSASQNTTRQVHSRIILNQEMGKTGKESEKQPKRIYKGQRLGLKRTKCTRRFAKRMVNMEGLNTQTEAGK